MILSLPVNGQNLTGMLKDSLNVPIPDVTIVLQTKDSVFVQAEFSDTLGRFNFKNIPNKDLRLIFQHLYYYPKTIEVKVGTMDINEIILYEKSHLLNEIAIIGERPEMKIENNALVYNMQRLAKGKAVANAFELIKEIPSIMANNDNLELVGSGKLNIIINGQVTTMSLEQVTSLLKSTPSSRVKNVGIMYNPPAKYNVRGALINIVMDNQSDTPKILGELNTSYKQSYYPSYMANGSMIYNSSKFNVDFLVNTDIGKNLNKMNTLSRHALSDRTVNIHETSKTINKYSDLTMRIGTDYTFNSGDNIKFSYYVKNGNSNGDSKSDIDFFDKENNFMHSLNNRDNNNWLHNANLLYSGKNKLNIGLEYTFFHDPSYSHFRDYKNYIENDNFQNNSRQDISRYSLLANHEINLKKNINITYGFNIGYNKSNSQISYLFNDGGIFIENPELLINSRQIEYTGNIFAESSYKISNKVTANLSFKAEYFRSNYDKNGINSVLWNQWTMFPNATVSISLTPNNLIQFNFTSDKNYPSYWSINPQTTYLNSYTEIRGNPKLMPSRTYRAQLMYIKNKKYILMGFLMYSPDYFTQLPFQDRNELRTIYRYENYNYSLRYGLALIIPLKVKDVLDSRFTLQGFRIHDKLDNFHNTSFNNVAYASTFMTNNSLHISKDKPNLYLQLNARYQSKAIQGIYNLGEIFDLSTGLKWIITKDVSILCQYNNIIKRRNPRPIKIDFEDQYSLRKNYEVSEFKFTFVWKFGNYKELKYKNIDDSRFSR